MSYGRFPAWGRGGCCSPLVTPDLIRGRLIEPCRSVTLERSDRVHGKSRHRVAVRHPPLKGTIATKQ